MQIQVINCENTLVWLAILIKLSVFMYFPRNKVTFNHATQATYLLDTIKVNLHKGLKVHILLKIASAIFFDFIVVKFS